MAKTYTGKRSFNIPDYSISNFFGLNTKIKDKKAFKKGITPDELNWITSDEGDSIYLRPGMALLGQTDNGFGKVTGLGIGKRYDGREVPFFSYGRKILYYDEDLDENVEVSTDILPIGASGEDVSISPYENIAGSFVYISSPNSSIYKIPIANPSSIVDLVSPTYRGKITIDQNRMFLWDRHDSNGGSDITAVYMSWIDRVLLSAYTSVSAEAVGALGSTTYNYNLAALSGVITVTIASPAVVTLNAHGFTAGTPIVFSTSGALPTGIIAGTTYYVISTGLTANTFQFSTTVGGSAVNTSGSQSGTHTITPRRRTCMYVIVKEAGGEILVDDRNGNLIGNQGSTGTINYVTGAISVTFNHTTTGAVTVDYYWEDSTVQGIADFSFATPSRVAGTGNQYRQDSGGAKLQAVFPLGAVEYCFHELKTWALTLTATDTSATNLPYRTQVGIKNFRSAFPTADGILFIDNSNPSEPEVKRLMVSSNDSTLIEPVPISGALDLSQFAFDYGIVFRWGTYDILCCQKVVNGVDQDYNSQFFVRNIVNGFWDRLEYNVNCLASYKGALIAGDSISNNPYVLFSGYDDDGEVIDNYWTTHDTDLDIIGKKVFNRLVLKGLIQKDQKVEIYASYDGGAYSKIFTVEGDAAYVDQGKPTTVGNRTIGSLVIGGGGVTTAYPFEVDFGVFSPQFSTVSLKIKAIDIGYAQFNEFIFRDIRYKGRGAMPTRIVN